MSADPLDSLEEPSAPPQRASSSVVPEPPRPHALVVLFVGLVVVALVAGLFWLGYRPYRARETALASEAARLKDLTPLVNVARPKLAPATAEVVLPGTLQPLQQTQVCARVNGYVKRWLVDIGDDVTSSQLLAEIETPELDQELRQTRATVLQLKARLEAADAMLTLAQSSLLRYTTAANKGGSSPQELAERQSAVATARAQVNAAKADVTVGEANVARLLELKTFASVAAPYTGTITQRSVEVGGLVGAGSGAEQVLFVIAQTDPLRVFVNVPQLYAAQVRPGDAASVVVRDFPGRPSGTVTRTARALDDARTLLTEIHIPNPERKLLPGAYAQVKLTLKRSQRSFVLPASALVVGPEGTTVATVADGKLHFRKVEVESDLGTEITIASGLDGSEDVVLNPGERLVEGIKVRVAAKAGAEK